MPEHVLTLFTQCYDIEENRHYWGKCTKIKSFLQKLLDFEQFAYVKEAIIKFYHFYSQPLIINQFEQRGILFCPALKLSIEQKCELKEGIKLLPNETVLQSTLINNSLIQSIIANLPLINEYNEQKITFETFMTAGTFMIELFSKRRTNKISSLLKSLQ